MSARSSKWAREQRRFGSAVADRDERLKRQASAIDRLVKVNMTYGDALVAMADAKNVREARKIAKDALKEGKDILAVEEERSA